MCVLSEQLVSFNFWKGIESARKKPIQILNAPYYNVATDRVLVTVVFESSIRYIEKMGNVA